MFLCQLQLSPAMIQHSWGKTHSSSWEAATISALFIYCVQYRSLRLHNIASSSVHNYSLFAWLESLFYWVQICGTAEVAVALPKLPWQLAAFGLIRRAWRKKPSDSWGKKKQNKQGKKDKKMKQKTMNNLSWSKKYTSPDMEDLLGLKTSTCMKSSNLSWNVYTVLTDLILL